jgi:hypothetical protein
MSRLMLYGDSVLSKTLQKFSSYIGSCSQSYYMRCIQAYQVDDMQYTVDVSGLEVNTSPIELYLDKVQTPGHEHIR